MQPKIIENQAIDWKKIESQSDHVLVVASSPKALNKKAVPGFAALERALKRRRAKFEEIGKSPVVTELGNGKVAAWVVLDVLTTFERHTRLRRALALLLAEQPETLTIVVLGDEAQRQRAAEEVLYVALLNSVRLPSRKSKDEFRPLKNIMIHGYQSADGYRRVRAIAEGNTLTRELTMLPPNELTPRLYRERIRELAKSKGWKLEEFDVKKLRALGAGAFVAVAQGSADDDAAIVHLSYRPKGAKKTVALIGKGICFDTGGHNLKPAKYMQGMHEDMNGSAVALGILSAATALDLPVRLDVWLAIAQNHIGPKAYKQNDVVTALNGTTIEIVHTDAEGRMVLADTLALAARDKPDAMIDFATLTGSCAVALGSRYSGIFSNDDALLNAALAAGKTSGERVSAFPIDEDYEPALDSKIADIKQCTMDGEADHILASRFLMRFIDKRPWLHMDLSASNAKEGLGAVASEVTGFGVGWGVEMLSAVFSRSF